MFCKIENGCKTVKQFDAVDDLVRFKIVKCCTKTCVLKLSNWWSGKFELEIKISYELNL